MGNIVVPYGSTTNANLWGCFDPSYRTTDVWGPLVTVDGASYKYCGCPDSMGVTGMYRNGCNELMCLEEFQCARPAQGDVECYDKDVSLLFDGAGTQSCGEDYVLSGFYLNLDTTCNGIHCIEHWKCCKWSSHIWETAVRADWSSSFDSQGWSYVDSNAYITGIERGGADHTGLYAIEFVDSATLTRGCSFVDESLTALTPISSDALEGYKSNFWLDATAQAMPDGSTYENFVVLHPFDQGSAESYAEFNLDRQYQSFTGIVGQALATVPSWCETGFGWYFNIFLDESRVAAYTSPTVTARTADQMHSFTISVTGVSTLRIQSYSDGTHACDWAAIFNPTLTPCGECSLTSMDPWASSALEGYKSNFWLDATTQAMPDGNTYDNFVVLHPWDQGSAESYAAFHLDGKWNTFSGIVGQALATVPSWCETGFGWYFKIFLDTDGSGEPVYTSPVVTARTADQMHSFAIDTTGVTTLRIQSYSDGTHACDWAAIFNPTLHNCPITGCADKATEREVVAGQIYGCPGTFASGGTVGTAAASLCEDGFHVCESAQEATDLGLTSYLCRDVAETDVEFFGTQETSHGGWQCESVYGNDQGLTNDVWGCARSTASGSALNNAATCQSLTSAIGNGNFYAWDLSAGSGENEAETYKLTDAANGGVLCCMNDYYHLQLEYDLALKYAPLLKFDRAGDSKGYPLSVSDTQRYYDVNVVTKHSQTWIENLNLANSETLYEVQECSDGFKLIYRFFYGYQHECMSADYLSGGLTQFVPEEWSAGDWTEWRDGFHWADWEQVIVHLDTAENPTKVSYWQHGDWYSVPIAEVSREGDHPVVYVGKNSHGAYHTSNTFGGGCGQFYDFRNPADESDFFRTWTKGLYRIDDQPFYTYTGEWDWADPNDPGISTNFHVEYCDVTDCRILDDGQLSESCYWRECDSEAELQCPRDECIGGDISAEVSGDILVQEIYDQFVNNEICGTFWDVLYGTHEIACTAFSFMVDCDDCALFGIGCDDWTDAFNPENWFAKADGLNIERRAPPQEAPEPDVDGEPVTIHPFYVLAALALCTVIISAVNFIVCSRRRRGKKSGYGRVATYDSQYQTETDTENV